MRVLPCVFLIALSKADRPHRPRNNDDELPSPVQRNVDVYPQKFVEPVPFGHITLEGFGDPYSLAKQPIDALELSMIRPKTVEEQNELLEKGIKNIRFIKNTVPKGFASPRDKYLSQIVTASAETNDTRLKWYDLAEIQSRNAMMPSRNQFLQNRKPRPHMMPSRPVDQKDIQFEKNSFQLKSDQAEVKVNWTTCDQFAVKAIFSPKDIVGFDWTPFYIWSLTFHKYAIVHRFTYPTKKLVDEYHTKYRRFLNNTIDWSQMKLLMTGMTEMLLIAADKRGLFNAIPKHEIPESATKSLLILPSLTLRLKIEDPYLVMMFCEDYFATVMAISGNEPTKYKEMKEEAATIKFVGTGQPVWRDFEGEKERKRIEQDIKLADEQSKNIAIVGPRPSVGQFDTLT